MSCDSIFIRKTLAFLPPGHPAARGGDSPFAGQAAHADGGKVWAHLRPLRQLARHAVHESSPLQLPVRGELCPVLSSYQDEVSFALFSPVTSTRWALPCSLQLPIWSELCPVLSTYQYEVSFALFSPVPSMRWASPCSLQLPVWGELCCVLLLPVWGELCSVHSSYQYEVNFIFSSYQYEVSLALFSPVTSMRWTLPCFPHLPVWGELCPVLSSYQYEVSFALFFSY